MHLKWLHMLGEYQMKMEYIYSSVKNCPCLNGRNLLVLYLTSRTCQKKKVKFSNLLLATTWVAMFSALSALTCYQSANNSHSNCHPCMSVRKTYQN